MAVYPYVYFCYLAHNVSVHSITDAVFDPTAQTDDVYQEVAMPIVESALSGFNGTIFVYGQTSSGNLSSLFLSVWVFSEE